MTAPFEGSAPGAPRNALEAILWRDRAVTIASLAAITFIAWVYILWLAAGMDGMDMGASAPGPMDMDRGDMNRMVAEMLKPALEPWGGVKFVTMFIMWTIMMIGMMTPSAAPMLLLYVRVGRAAQIQSKPFAPTAWFAGGYFVAWSSFSLVATAAQWALERTALLSPTMATNSRLFGGAVLIAAGLYELTPLKRACLAHCRAPLAFLQAYGGFRRDPAGAITFGIHHGLYCIGCCWALMGLLFVGGVMNVLWIAGLAALVLAEKVLPFGSTFSAVTGVALLGVGLWMVL